MRTQTLNTDRRYANLHYIRAAILQRTGITLTLRQVNDYLVEEGLITDKYASTLMFDNYDSLYHTIDKRDSKRFEGVVPIDKMIDDNTEYMKEIEKVD